MTSSTALPLPIVRFTPSTFAMARQPYSLTCTVQVVQYLAAIPDVTWLDSDGSSLQNRSDITLMQPMRNGNITALNLSVGQLAESHTGNYTCRACISINEVAIEGHCGRVMAEVTLSGKYNFYFTLCLQFHFLNFFFSSRKGPKPRIYTYLRPVCESTLERASEHQWSYCELHCTSAEVPTCEWIIKGVGAGGS